MNDHINTKLIENSRKTHEVLSSILLTVIVLWVAIGTSLTEVYFFCVFTFTLFFISIICFEAINKRSKKLSKSKESWNGDLTLPLISNKIDDLSFETILYELETRDDSICY